VTYFLYEAYTARGDLLFANGDFGGALRDYQSADRYAWSNGGNLLRLLQIETRLGRTLHKTGQIKQSAAFYQAAFDRLGYQKRLTGPDQQDLLKTLTQADTAYGSGGALQAIGLYETAMKQADKFYEQKKVAVNRDDTLPNVAFENDSSLESLRTANQLGESLIVGQDRDMLIPVMPPSGP
jgi:tetratricopeptide (TPR) repeat protein